jgi:double-strand break repair protein MRE11
MISEGQKQAVQLAAGGEEAADNNAAAIDVDAARPRKSVNSPPLVRLKVEYSGFNTINAQRFGRLFVGRVANPGDILLFYRKKTTSLFGTRPALRSAAENEILARATRIPDPMDQTNMDELISSYLGQEIIAPHLLLDKDFQDALHNFVEKEETDAFAQLVAGSSKSMEQFLIKDGEATFTGQEDPKMVLEIMSERTRKVKEERDAEASVKAESQRNAEGDMEVDLEADLSAPSSSKPNQLFKTPTKPTAKASAAPAKTGAGRGRGRGAKAAGASQSAPNSIEKSRTRTRIKNDDDDEVDVFAENDRQAPALDLLENDYVDDDIEAQNLMVTPKTTPKSTPKSTPQSKVKLEPPKSQSPKKSSPATVATKKRKAAQIADDDDENGDSEFLDDAVHSTPPPPAKRPKPSTPPAASPKAGDSSKSKAAIDLTEDDDGDDVAAMPPPKKSVVSNWGPRKTGK